MSDGVRFDCVQFSHLKDWATSIISDYNDVEEVG